MKTVDPQSVRSAVQPEISVVIPTFRRPAQLKQALQSVIDQDDAALEIIVVDDSAEGSAAPVVEAFQDPRIRYMKNPKPTGGVPSVVRNIGLQNCHGALVHFLDDDDIVPKGYYKVVRREFNQNGRVGIVFGRIEPFGDCPPEQLAAEKDFFGRSGQRAKMCSRLGQVWPFVGQMMFGHVLLVCSSAILRRDCVEAIGGFDPKITLHEDRDLFVRIMRKYGARFLDQVSLHYRIGYPSLMHSTAPTPEQLELERQGNIMVKKKYMKFQGRLEYYALNITTKLLNKTLYR